MRVDRRGTCDRRHTGTGSEAKSGSGMRGVTPPIRRRTRLGGAMSSECDSRALTLKGGPVHDAPAARSGRLSRIGLVHAIEVFGENRRAV